MEVAAGESVRSSGACGWPERGPVILMASQGPAATQTLADRRYMLELSSDG